MLLDLCPRRSGLDLQQKLRCLSRRCADLKCFLSLLRSDFLSRGFGADVEELAEECSAVRFQLEHLQRLLLQVSTSTLMWKICGVISLRFEVTRRLQLTAAAAAAPPLSSQSIFSPLSLPLLPPDSLTLISSVF